MTNERISRLLREHASHLEQVGENLYRIRAYRHGAFEVLRSNKPLHEVFTCSGRKGLEAIPGIGPSLAGTIVELLTTGKVDARKVA